MMKYVLGAGLLVALTTPGLAQSSTNAPQPKPVINPSGSTTTTTTTEQYDGVRDPATKRCTTTTSKPTDGTTGVVGDTVYKSKTEAETAITQVCTN